MASTNKTLNYLLSQFLGTDRLQRTDYNSDMSKIDTALKGLEDLKAVKGMPYTKNEGGTKTVTITPVGGQKSFPNNTVGAKKIKLPSKSSFILYGFKLRINGYNGDGAAASNIELDIVGWNPSVFNTQEEKENCTVSIKSDKNYNIPISFCLGLTEDYIIIGNIYDKHRYLDIEIFDLRYNTIVGVDSDWSTGWDISLVTTLETLESTNKITVIPSLNATSLEGTTTTTTGEINKIFKWSDVANTIKTLFKILIDSTTAFRVAKSNDIEVFNVDTINENVTGLAVSTIGAANKLLKFSSVANTILHFFIIKKSSTTAIDVQNDAGTSVFNVDTISGVATGSAVSALEIGDKLVKRNSSGKIAGLENVTNTSDTNKPVSTAQQTALDLKLNNLDVAETGASKVLRRKADGNINGTINLNGDKTIDLGNDKDLNTVTSTGLYRANSTATNVPFAGGTWHLEVISYTTSWIFQRIKNFGTGGGGGNGETYERVCANGTWSSWVKSATVNDILGVNQTWQNVTGNRALGTTYVNTTGKQIFVSFVGNHSAIQTTINCEVNGLIISYVYDDGNRAQQQGFIVNNGDSYKIYVSSGSGTIGKWSELR